MDGRWECQPRLRCLPECALGRSCTCITCICIIAVLIRTIIWPSDVLRAIIPTRRNKIETLNNMVIRFTCICM